MSEIKIDISDQFSKTINELEDKDFEYVFTLCSDAEENCPVLFKGKTIHIGFEDPPKLTEDIDDDIKKLQEKKVYYENLLNERKLLLKLLVEELLELKKKHNVNRKTK